MTLTEMRYLVALARERHFGKAADVCHVSQPTLSVAIKKVEGQLGAALFERSAGSRLKPHWQFLSGSGQMLGPGERGEICARGSSRTRRRISARSAGVPAACLSA